MSGGRLRHFERKRSRREVLVESGHDDSCNGGVGSVVDKPHSKDTPLHIRHVSSCACLAALELAVLAPAMAGACWAFPFWQIELESAQQWADHRELLDWAGWYPIGLRREDPHEHRPPGQEHMVDRQE